MLPVMRQILLSKRRPIVKDSFNRANNNTSLGVADTGQTWTTLTGTLGIDSNKAKGFAASGNLGIIKAAKNIRVKIDLTLGSDIELNSLWVRNDGLGSINRMYVQSSNIEIKLVKLINSVATTLATYNHSWATGATKNLIFVANGNDFTVYLNGVPVITATDDNTLKSNEYVGITLYSASGLVPISVFDNLIVEAI